MDCRVVLFDLDGVITDTAIFHYEAWKKLADRLHIDFDEAFNEHLKGVSRIESLRRILEHGGVEEQYDEEALESMATEKNEMYKQLIQKVTPEDVYPGIIESFQWLKSREIPIVLASASRNAPSIIRSLDIESYIDYIVSPDEIKHNKPAPDIFIAGAERCQALHEQCIVVEDAYTGVEAGKKAGMYVIGIGQPEVLGKADHVLSTTEQLTHVFENLIQK